MLSLNLGARSLVTLRASAFPDRADVYICDKCGRDVTRHFHALQSHSWSTIGRESYTCLCGEKYLTGATEWDHLDSSERIKSVGQTVFIGVFLSAGFSILGLVAYLALHFAFGLREAAVVAALAVTALPFVLMQIRFWPAVIASIWRTRAGDREQESK